MSRWVSPNLKKEQKKSTKNKPVHSEAVNLVRAFIATVCLLGINQIEQPKKATSCQMPSLDQIRWLDRELTERIKARIERTKAAAFFDPFDQHRKKPSHLSHFLYRGRNRIGHTRGQ